MATASDDDKKVSANTPGLDDERKLFVGALNRSTTYEQFRQYFTKFGNIESACLKVDYKTGRSRGFGYVVFADRRSIDEVLKVEVHVIDHKQVDPKRVWSNSESIFVGGLTKEHSDEMIMDFFSQFGNVMKIHTPLDDNEQRKGFCFVTLDSKEATLNALKTSQVTINGKLLDVKKATRDYSKQNLTAPLQSSKAPVMDINESFEKIEGIRSFEGMLDYTDPRAEFAFYEFGLSESPPTSDFGVPRAESTTGVRKYHRRWIP